LRWRIRSALSSAANETFDRFNPIIGGTYKITSELTAYAGYSEANRAPTPLELGCADPTRPCIIAAFLVSDPTFFETALLPNFANGGAAFTDARSLSPARPRSLYAGLKMTF